MPKKEIEAHRAFKDGREYWYVVTPTDMRQSGDQRTHWFKKKSAAMIYAQKLQALRDDIGRAFFSMPKQDQGALLKLVEMSGGVQSVLDAVEYHKTQRPELEISLKDLIEQATKAKELSGMTEHYTKCFRIACKQFALGRELMPASAIQPAHIESWLNQPRKPAWSQATKANYLRSLIALFSYAQAHRYCKDNPAANVTKPVQKDTSPEILTVADAERLLRNAEQKDRGLLNYIALCLFGGLRPSEAMRITRENIKESHVEVFGKRVRVRNRRLVTINDTLKAWLDRNGEFPNGWNLRRRMREVRKGIKWKQDCMRHSFVSYHYAIHGAKETAKEAGHSEQILFAHYRELVTKEDAERFWGIRPI